MFVAAFDPGRTTGYAQVAFGKQGADGVRPLLTVFTKQLASVDEVRDQMMLTRMADVIIVEDFIGSGPRTADAVFTLKLVGLLEYGFPNTTVIMQNPQRRKPFVSIAREMLNAQHKDRHGADALAHILSWHHTYQSA